VKTINVTVEVGSRGKKCERCRFVKLNREMSTVCLLFNKELTHHVDDRTCWVSYDRLPECKACEI
jgi:hypothetical protein